MRVFVMPDDDCPDFAFFKARIFENPSNICYIVLYSAMKFHLMFYSFKRNILSQNVAKSQLSHAI